MTMQFHFTLLTLFLLFFSIPSPGSPVILTKTMTECGKNEDCQIICGDCNSCCCGNVGSVSLNKERVQSYFSEMLKTCTQQGVACSCPSKIVKPACINHSCIIADSDGADVFADKLYGLILKNDFKGYLNLVNKDCKMKENSETAFHMRSDLVQKQKPGIKVEVITFSAHRELKIKSGHPFDQVYTVEPSHYVIAWPLESLPSRGTRIDLNPIVKINGDWKILEGSCISSKKN